MVRVVTLFFGGVLLCSSFAIGAERCSGAATTISDTISASGELLANEGKYTFSFFPEAEDYHQARAILVRKADAPVSLQSLTVNVYGRVDRNPDPRWDLTFGSVTHHIQYWSSVADFERAPRAPMGAIDISPPVRPAPFGSKVDGKTRYNITLDISKLGAVVTKGQVFVIGYYATAHYPEPVYLSLSKAHTAPELAERYLFLNSFFLRGWELSNLPDAWAATITGARC